MFSRLLVDLSRMTKFGSSKKYYHIISPDLSLAARLLSDFFLTRLDDGSPGPENEIQLKNNVTLNNDQIVVKYITIVSVSIMCFQSAKLRF